MPRRATRAEPLLGAPTPSLMSVGAPSLMAATGPVALTVYQGDDKRWLFKLYADALRTVPFDLSNYEADLQFRITVADNAAEVGDVPVNPVVTINEPKTSGEIVVTLNSGLSQLMRETEYLWDLEITDIEATPEPWTTTVAAGTLTVTKEVTRTTP